MYGILNIMNIIFFHFTLCDFNAFQQMKTWNVRERALGLGMIPSFNGGRSIAEEYITFCSQQAYIHRTPIDTKRISHPCFATGFPR
jgi:hypothetical protein